MKILEKELRTRIATNNSLESLGDLLTFSGLEVEGYTDYAPQFSGVVGALVTAVEPAGEYLKVTTKHGEIITSDTTVKVDEVVALAKIGAKLAGRDIQPIELAGVRSMGALVSEKELGLTDANDAVMRLALTEDGVDIASEIGTDRMMELAITPNRGDCACLRGVVRELHVLIDAEFDLVYPKDVKTNIDDVAKVTNSAPHACPVYGSMIIKGIPKGPAPLALRTKLMRSGVRSINYVVDVLNCVMLQMGQPMHAFDLDTIGDIEVRFAKAGEKILLLDGKEIELADSDLVIASNGKAIALAGIMGDLASSVTDKTTNVLLEAAHFTPEVIAASARRHHINSDSSYRFERGVDPEVPVQALNRAAELIGQAKYGPATIQGTPPARQLVSCPRSLPNEILGIPVLDDDIRDILRRLGFKFKIGETIDVEVPPHRFDVAIAEDIVEELGRIIGYDQIPTTMPRVLASEKIEYNDARSEFRLRDHLVARGFNEVINYSFVNPEFLEHFGYTGSLPLKNPLAREFSMMRPAIFPSLVMTQMHNLKRRVLDMQIFEIGKHYSFDHETDCLSMLVCGKSYEGPFGAREFDFYDLKGVLEDWWHGLGFSLKPQQFDFLHQGQSAAVFVDGAEVGFIGRLSPRIESKLDLPATFVAEIHLEHLLKGDIPKAPDVSKFQSVRRDLALVVPQDTQAAEIISAIESTSELLTDVVIFDVYQGKGVPEGSKSLAIGLRFVHPERTLEESDIEASVSEAINICNQKFGAQLR